MLKRPLLVTAKHVVEAYLNRQHDDPALEFQVGFGALTDIASRVVEASSPVDIAAIDLSGFTTRSFAPHLEFYEPDHWPPERIEVGAHAILSGFPKSYRRFIHQERAISFKSWHLHSRVHGKTADRFSCVIDVEVTRGNRPRGDWPDTYGALSGGPVFTLRGDVQRIELAGIMHQASDGFNIIEAHHADLTPI